MDRSQVLAWYEKQINHSNFLGIRMPTLLLNFPPEEAQTLIRDQTGSTYLQQFVHPFRESWYVNGSETPAGSLKPHFFVEGKYWNEKIIIRYIPTNIWIREGIFIATAIVMVIIYKAFSNSFKKENGK